jgi:hypothetical protein
MAFPISPINNQVAVVNGISYTYNSTTTAWVRNFSAGGNVTIGNLTVNTGIFWSNGTAWSSGSGGGGSITYTANTAPPTTGNTVGSQWYNTSTDTLYEYEYDGTSYHWVDITTPTFSANSSNLISGNLTVTGNVFVQSNAASGTVTRVEYNIPHPFMLMGAT